MAKQWSEKKTDTSCKARHFSAYSLADSWSSGALVFLKCDLCHHYWLLQFQQCPAQWIGIRKLSHKCLSLSLQHWLLLPIFVDAIQSNLKDLLILVWKTNLLLWIWNWNWIFSFDHHTFSRADRRKLQFILNNWNQVRRVKPLSTHTHTKHSSHRDEFRMKFRRRNNHTKINVTRETMQPPFEILSLSHAHRHTMWFGIWSTLNHFYLRFISKTTKQPARNYIDNVHRMRSNEINSLCVEPCESFIE